MPTYGPREKKRKEWSRTTTSDTKRADVIRRATELFDEYGYHTTSMQDIADAVNLAKPSLYHYFSSKDEILHLIHDEFIELLIGKHEARAKTADTKTLLRGSMGDVLELMKTHRGSVRVFFESHRDLHPDHHAEIVLKRRQYEQMITDVVKQGVGDGTFRADLSDRDPSVTLTVKAMFGMCNWAYQWYQVSGELQPREISDFFWRILEYGLVPPSQREIDDGGQAAVPLVAGDGGEG